MTNTLTARPDASESGVSLLEIPALVAMEWTCAAVGILVSIGWGTYYIASIHPQLSTNAFMLGVPAIAIFCFIGALLCIRACDTAVMDSDQAKARAWLWCCSAACVIGMILLIWASGGPLSPVITLYVMTHTLTLASIKMKRGPIWVAGFFAAGVIVALVLSWQQPLAPPAVFDDLLGGTKALLAIGIGAVGSIVVATGGAIWNNQTRAVSERWRRIESSRGYEEGEPVVRRTRAKQAVLWLGDLAAKSGQTVTIKVGTNDIFRATLGADPKVKARAAIEFDNWRVIYRIYRPLFGQSGRLLRFASDYLSGRCNVTGDPLVVARVADMLETKPAARLGVKLGRVARWLGHVVHAEGLFGSSLGHYGLSSKAYELFLDAYMQYTCALWEDDPQLDPGPSNYGEARRELGTAQRRKLDLIDTWLELESGESLLDVGCGWGGLVRFFSERGVVAWGITNSDGQLQAARKYLSTCRGASQRVVLTDFFDFDPARTFDAITVVGMLEHVPEDRRNEFFEKVASHLNPDGKLYLQCITKSTSWSGGDGSRFLQKEVFPGYTLESFETVLRRATAAGLQMINSREDHAHYGRTLLLWSFQVAAKEVDIKKALALDTGRPARRKAAPGGRGGLTPADREFRVLRAYLSLAALVFDSGRGNVHRAVFSRTPADRPQEDRTEVSASVD